MEKWQHECQLFWGKIRIIYKIEKDMILIKVMRISAHDYAR